MDDSYDWFFRNEYATVLLSARVILQDHQAAQDIAQEAFARLYRHWGRVSKYEKPVAWVRRVAIRIAVKEARKRRLWSAWKPEAEPQHNDVVYDADLMASIAQLPAKQRATVVLFYLEDRPLAEVGEILECSESTAAVHLHRARKRLAHLLGEPFEAKEAEGVA